MIDGTTPEPALSVMVVFPEHNNMLMGPGNENGVTGKAVDVKR
jgi:hypothetical protein